MSNNAKLNIMIANAKKLGMKPPSTKRADYQEQFKAYLSYIAEVADGPNNWYQLLFKV